MSRFTKKITQEWHGPVRANVYDSRGEVVGEKTISSPWHNQEKRLQRAHAWADRWLENCEKYVIEDGRPVSEKETAAKSAIYSIGRDEDYETALRLRAVVREYIHLLESMVRERDQKISEAAINAGLAGEVQS